MKSKVETTGTGKEEMEEWNSETRQKKLKEGVEEAVVPNWRMFLCFFKLSWFDLPRSIYCSHIYVYPSPIDMTSFMDDPLSKKLERGEVNLFSLFSDWTRQQWQHFLNTQSARSSYSHHIKHTQHPQQTHKHSGVPPTHFST